MFYFYFLLFLLDPKTSVLGILGDHFGTLGVDFGDPGLHFGVFLEALTPLGAHFGHFGENSKKWEPFSRRIPVHFGSIFGQFLKALAALLANPLKT